MFQVLPTTRCLLEALAEGQTNTLLGDFLTPLPLVPAVIGASCSSTIITRYCSI